MADAYTGVGASNFDQTAYDRRAFYALRPELYFDAAATVQPTAQSMPGAVVIMNITTDMSAATTTLAESTDVSAVALADSQVTFTLAEYGNAALTTAKLRGTAYVAYDPVVANLIGYNAGLSLDTVARDVVKGGTNVDYATGSGSLPAGRTTVTPSNTVGGAEVRKEVAALRRGNTQPYGGYYLAYIHPDVSVDLRGATGLADWVAPHAYSDPTNIWNGEIGAYAGARFIETPRCEIVADAGSSTTNTDIYETYFLAQEALGKAYSYTDGNGPLPAIVPGPVTDKLRRFVPMGWYWLGTYAIFRQTCIRRLESASSIGLNAAAGTN